MKLLFSHQTEKESHQFVGIPEEVKEERKSADIDFKDININHSGNESESDSEEDYMAV